MQTGNLYRRTFGFLKLCIISVCCMYVGFVLQEKQRPAVEDLEYRAAVAWNQGDLDLAEKLARNVMGRHPKSARAHEILLRLADPLGRPEIEFALMLPEQQEPLRQEQLLGAVRVALNSHLFRVANQYASDGVKRFPQNAALQSQYVSLSGLQLDADEMQRLLMQWAQSSAPTADLVLMSIGLSSIDSRAASSSEVWLRAAVEADASDVESRMGLGRCLIAMGRYRECAQILDCCRANSKVAVLLAVAYASEKNLTASDLLPSSEPDDLKADYWYAKGLVATEQLDWIEAELCFRKAVQHRPLSQAYRSRHCEVLRRLDDPVEQSAQVEHLKTVIRIVQKSSDTTLPKDSETLIQLAEMCTSVGADEAARLLSMAVVSAGEKP